MITSSISSAAQGIVRVLDKHAEHASGMNRIGGQSPESEPRESVQEKSRKLAEAEPPGMVKRKPEASPTADPAGETTGMMTTRRAFEANLRSLKLSDDMLQSLLDIFA